MTTNANTQPSPNAAPVDEEAMHAFAMKMVQDLGAAVSGSLVVVGDRLGLYKALADIAPATSVQLAEHTHYDERYLREWLSAQAASGYVQYDPATACFSMSPAQVAVFADPHSSIAMTGGFYSVASTYIDEPKITEAFRTGGGVQWGDHHNCLFCGTEKFFRPGYENNLVNAWIPALDGVEERLNSGIRVTDIGCGFGASTLIMAKAFPKSEFVGYDIHAASIEHAREHATAEGLTNVSFEVATAKDFTGGPFDFVTIFDALHDMGDPVGAAVQVAKNLTPEGTWMIVEPRAGDSLEENLNPIGRVYYGFSTMVCTPSSKSQDVGLALGAQAGEARLRGVVTEGGFSRFSRATETPFNLILQAQL
jgi:2-polyprenyl-3-methyl-5-hydroxy-6-metoxy-1,4-benzoquinol methylase